MLYGLYLSAAGMQAQENRQSVISNNLANAQTNGFKRDLAVMQARANATHEDPRMLPYQVPVLKDQGGGVTIAGGGIDMTQAALVRTKNPTDLALNGKGFFQVQGENPGDKLLTRDGSFLVNSNGTLVMANGGRPVLSSEGQPITLKLDVPITVGAGGQIHQGDTTVQLGLADVSDSRRLVKLGNNLLTTDKPEAATAISSSTQVEQGQLEQSGVDPIVEMVTMMEGQRAFEANAKMITYQDTTLSELNTIGKIA